MKASRISKILMLADSKLRGNKNATLVVESERIKRAVKSFFPYARVEVEKFRLDPTILLDDLLLWVLDYGNHEYD